MKNTLVPTKRRRVDYDSGHLFVWNAGIGPLLNPTKIIKIAEAIPQFAQARHWSLRWNQIRKVELTRVDLQRYDISTTVDILDLSHNDITHFNVQSAPFLSASYLNLSNNRLTDISNLHLLSELKELYLSGNRLTSLRFLRDAKCRSTLEVLDVSKNQLSSFSTIGELVLFGNLKWVSIEQNQLPVEGFVILACPSIKFFGGKRVTPNIRREVEFWSITEAEGEEVVECVNLFCEAFLGEGSERMLPSIESITVPKEIRKTVEDKAITTEAL